jgi:hypothetical protein
MQFNVKLANIAEVFGPRWDEGLGRAAQVRLAQLNFVVDADPPPEGWPLEPDITFTMLTQDPTMLEGIDTGNRDQVYTLTLVPATTGRAAKGKSAAKAAAANPEAHPSHAPPAHEAQKEKHQAPRGGHR